MIIDATAGGAAANSYADVAAADLFLLQERLGGSAWDEVVDKPAALIMATQQLERFEGQGGDQCRDVTTVEEPPFPPDTPKPGNDS